MVGIGTEKPREQARGLGHKGIFGFILKAQGEAIRG